VRRAVEGLRALRGARASRAARLRDAEPVDGLKWEILVIDNNSPDDTKSVVESFRERNRIEAITVFAPEPGKTCALNRGLADATGTFMAFLDHDVVLAPEYLRGLQQAMRTQPYNVFGGRVQPIWPSPSPAWAGSRCRPRGAG
jgi:glucosyl-dolichyl phosphate glucuronosyltransferase